MQHLVQNTRKMSVTSNERTFYTLQLLKFYLRNEMNQDRISALAMLHIHHDVSFDAEDISILLSKKKRNLAINS